MGLVFVLTLPYGTIPLLQTKKSESIPALFYRYLDTPLHIDKWYQDDLLDKECEGHKSLTQVRKMHQNIYETMKKIPHPEGLVWVSQYNMVVTQWAFVGLAMMYPDESGIKKESQEKVLKSVNLVWRTIGYLLGIKDQYNLCQEDYKDTIALCQLIFRDVYLPVVTHESNEKENIGYHMGLDVLKALKSIAPPAFGEPRALINFWYEVFEIPKNFRPKMNLQEKISMAIISFSKRKLLTRDWIRSYMNRKGDEKLEEANNNRRKIHKKLTKKYPEVKYTPDGYSKCPFQVAHLPSFSDKNADVKTPNNN